MSGQVLDEFCDGEGVDRAGATKKPKDHLSWKTTHEEIYSFSGMTWPPGDNLMEDLGGLDGLSNKFHMGLI